MAPVLMQDNAAESDLCMVNAKWGGKLLAAMQIGPRRKIVKKDVDADTKDFHSPLRKWGMVYT